MNVEKSLEKLNDYINQNIDPYSNIYLFFRAYAILNSEVETEIKSIRDSLYLENAYGQNLDLKALDYGKVRSQGNKSNGNILIESSKRINLPKGLVLTDASQTFQFQLLTDISLFPNIESIGYIEGLSNGLLSNLPAGSVLSNSFYPTIKFTVGQYRLGNTIVGNLSGGDDYEDDDSFKERLKRLNERDYLTNQIKKIGGINKVYIKEYQGYFEVYVDTNSSIITNEVKKVVDSYKPLGVPYLIKNILIESVNLTIYLKESSVDLQKKLYYYFNKLKVGEDINLEYLKLHLNADKILVNNYNLNDKILLNIGTVNIITNEELPTSS